MLAVITLQDLAVARVKLDTLGMAKVVLICSLIETGKLTFSTHKLTSMLAYSRY